MTNTQTEIIYTLRERGWMVSRINSGFKGHVAFNKWYLPNVLFDWVLPLAQEIWPNDNILTRLTQLQNGQTSGFSDLLCLKDGKAVFLEVKQPGETRQRHQRLFAGIVKKQGFKHAYVESVDQAIEAVGEDVPGSDDDCACDDANCPCAEAAFGDPREGVI